MSRWAGSCDWWAPMNEKDDLMWDVVVLVGIVVGFWAAIGFIALIHHL